MYLPINYSTISRLFYISCIISTFYSVVHAYVVVVRPVEPEWEAEESGMEPFKEVKRNARLFSTLSNKEEDVCATRVLYDHAPAFGHITNGSRVEIQQDEESSLVATFVECVRDDRPSCIGIDISRYTSECVTEYVHRPAGIRLVGSNAPFVIGSVRIPIMCQCRIRKYDRHFLRK